MKRPSHDEYFVSILKLVAARSTCARRAVGAIITDERHKILATGYNGVPSGRPHCTDIPCPGFADQPGDNRRCAAIHAEVNAILQCHALELAHTLYVSCTPCHSCAKMICNTPIKRIVCLEQYPDVGEETLRDSGIDVLVWGLT